MLARENAERLGLLERIQFWQGHLLDPIEGSFDLIVANLPYVAASEAKQLAPEVRHDPPLALYGGETGDELIRELIAAAPPYLRPGGTLALEIGIDQEVGLSEFLMMKNYRDIRLKNDYAGIGRFLCGVVLQTVRDHVQDCIRSEHSVFVSKVLLFLSGLEVEM